MMATAEQRRALLAQPCPWCRAEVGVDCSTPGPSGARLPITSLDGGAHDARWMAVFAVPAPVLLVRESKAPADVDREPVLVGAVECPW